MASRTLARQGLIAGIGTYCVGVAFNQENLARMLAQDAFHDFTQSVEIGHFFGPDKGFIEAEMHGIDFNARQGLAQGW